MNSICKKYNFQNNAGKARIIIAIIAIAIMLIGLIIFLVGSFLPQIPQNGTTMINSQPM
jgi:CHASE2 domain-containing sensor protein